MFKAFRRVELADGRELLVEYQGERYGWGAYVSESVKSMSANTPAAAISECLGYRTQAVPAWVSELSDDFERELREAPRYPCPCCGYKTLLNPNWFEICAVCGWEDEPGLTSEDEKSGPNHISLRQARDNFAAFGAVDEDSKSRVREPRLGE